MTNISQFMFNYWANQSFQNILMESQGIGSDPGRPWCSSVCRSVCWLSIWCCSAGVCAGEV